jgi:hypothetical protein
MLHSGHGLHLHFGHGSHGFGGRAEPAEATTSATTNTETTPARRRANERVSEGFTSR